MEGAENMMSWLPVLTVGMLGWLVCWGAWVTLRLMSNSATCLTREEHTAVCTAKDIELNRRFDKLERTMDDQFKEVQKSLDKQDTTSTEARQTQNNLMQDIRVALAVLSGPPPPTARRVSK